MDRDVERFISACSECFKKPKSNTTSCMYRWEVEPLPFRRIHMDWACLPKVGEVLIIVDAMSGWPEAFPCPDRSSKSVLKVLKAVFSRFGVPLQLVSDNAKEFISEEVEAWLRMVGTEKVQSPQYHPQSNGCVERMVQMVKRVMGLWTVGKGTFQEYLQKVLLTYRTSRCVGNRNKTPAELVLGYPIRHPLVAYSGGQQVMYRPSGKQAMEAEVMVQNSKRTIYVQKVNGDVVLAHADQITPMVTTATTTDTVEQDVKQESDVVDGTEAVQEDVPEQVREKVPEQRYPSRVRHEPDRFQP